MRYLLLLCMMMIAVPLYSMSMNVFYPSLVSVQDRQKALLASPLKVKNVMVFAKFREFHTFQKLKPADILIIPDAYARTLKGYQCKNRFTLSGRGKFRYQILTLDKSWDLSKASNGILGVVDESGRRKMRQYLSSILPGVKFKQIKSVGKLEDLMAMMALEGANYVLIRLEHRNGLKAQFDFQTFKIEESSEVNYPFICVKDGASFDLSKFNASLLKILGFSTIEVAK
ncbi:MAG: hypothetical protein HRU19_01170 [Pseudobacteriovorax sp.]|nr:hypothetical protein [Pseudobacteriovorax sp.]